MGWISSTEHHGVDDQYRALCGGSAVGLQSLMGADQQYNASWGGAAVQNLIERISSTEHRGEGQQYRASWGGSAVQSLTGRISSTEPPKTKLLNVALAFTSDVTLCVGTPR